MLKYKQEDGCGGENSEMFMDQVDRFDEEFGDTNDSGQGAWSEISKRAAIKLSDNVFSITSFKGDVMLRACSSIVIRSEPHIKTLLTSASLIRYSHDENRIEDDLSIRVNSYYLNYIDGWLGDYNLDYNLLLVNIKTPHLPVARLDHQVQLASCSKVFAVGRVYNSKKLMATSGLVKDMASIFDHEEIIVSTCKISKAGIGGPLVDVDGYFYGMNFYGLEETPFLPRIIILKCLKSFGMFGYAGIGGPLVDIDGNFLGMNFCDEEETPFLPRNVILECLRQFETRGILAADNIKPCPSRWPLCKPYWVYPIEEQLDPWKLIELPLMSLDTSSPHCDN